MVQTKQQGKPMEEGQASQAANTGQIERAFRAPATVDRLCALARVSRAGYYRWWSEEEPKAEETEVRAAIQEITLKHRRRYGYRRVTRELRRRGMHVNHKRVRRLMAEDNLLAVRRRKWVATTDSGHEMKVHLNLAARMQLSGVNQLWVADITYIRLRDEFVYLAVVLDRYSRKVIGWALMRNLTAELAVTALKRAIQARRPGPGLVHHSDRGTQYASQEYANILSQYSITPSMSAAASPWENGACEGFMRTLKAEEIDASVYSTMEELEANLEEFIETYYNRQRLHSALGYQSPEEFEQSLGTEPSLGATVTCTVKPVKSHSAGEGGKRSASKSSPDIVAGVCVTAGEAGAGQPDNAGHACGGNALGQQVPDHPQVDDTPVGVGVALGDSPTGDQAAVDGASLVGVDGCETQIRISGLVKITGDRGVEQQLGVGRQAGGGMQDGDPGSAPVAVAALGLAVGETGEPTHVIPADRAGISAVGSGQAPGDGRGQQRVDGGTADPDPSLQPPGAGPDHGAGLEAVAAHTVHGGKAARVQVDQDVARVGHAREGHEVDIVAFAIAGAEEAKSGPGTDLGASPDPVAGQCTTGAVVNQPEEVKLVGKRAQEPSGGAHRNHQAEVTHVPMVKRE